MTDLRENIQSALADFQSRPLPEAARRLFGVLGYESERTIPLRGVKDFLTTFDPQGRLTPKEQETLSNLSSLHLLFQLSDAELTHQSGLFDSKTAIDGTLIQSYLFFAAELPAGHYNRTTLSNIARAINKPLPMPALVLIRHGDSISLAIVHRRLHKREQSKDVLEKVTLIKDIALADPIRAHLEILNDFGLEKLGDDFGVSNFVALHEAWQKRLGSFALSNDFYREIADWYFWAHHLVNDGTIRLPEHCDTEQEKSLFLIRLLTRLIFSWFLVEKRLLPPDLFRANSLKNFLKDFGPDKPTYYHAILQNLFFGTLNMPPEQRAFRQKKKEGERYDQNFGITNLWRYEADFQNPAAWVKLAERIPFLNGGLFDCLDDKTGKKTDNSMLDGFSDNPRLACQLPNDLFFGPERTVDLSKDYGEEDKRTARSKKAKVRGLIEILSRYKFTIEENTPLEEEIALDPELLGKVFENLLASYNEDTRTTARKALGAFYTPREIVGYMVDEALKSYLATQVPRCKGALDDLFSNKATLKEIKPDTREALIAAIGRVKILDPACGSGAFPMGALHRLVDLLQKLDPNNESWKRDRLSEARRYCDLLDEAGAGKDELAACELRMGDIEKSFDTRFHALDFARKLYLIENCIYGVDIQPIATQIAKLRFFISLVVDQIVDPKAPNLGVRPLPNLETRLVAADSLIPIPRPEIGQTSLFEDTAGAFHAVQSLKSMLAAVRHEHFNARDPRKKRECREEDATLRAQLADVLQKTGMAAPIAGKLAAWDPYDQNSFAPFFDPEWMFGLPVGKVRIEGKSAATLLGNLALINEVGGQTELTPNALREIDSGFDLVIGNPPYGIKFPASQKRSLSEFYPQAARVLDSYAIFILKGITLLRPGGVLAYIVPNTFCDLENGDEFRRHLLSSTSVQTIWQSGWVFSAAVVDTLVLLLDTSTPKASHEVLVITEKGRERRSQAGFLALPLSKIDFRSTANVIDLKEQIRSKSRPLSSQFYVKAGVKMYELGKGEPPQTREIVDSKPYSRSGKVSASWKTLYRGADIAPFRISDAGERVRYGPWLAAPRSPDLFSPPKILMRRTDDRLRSCLDLTDSICVNSCHVIKLHDLEQDALAKYHATLAVLNSRVCQWMFEAENPQMVGKTFAEIKVVYVERLPLPYIDRTHQEVIRPIVQIVLWINSAFSDDSTQATRDPLMLAYWERILNGLVYELYFPDEVHGAGLHLFDLTAAAKIPDVAKIPEPERLPRLRALFETLHDGSHPLRIALDKLQTLDTIRIIEGKA